MIIIEFRLLEGTKRMKTRKAFIRSSEVTK